MVDDRLDPDVAALFDDAADAARRLGADGDDFVDDLVLLEALLSMGDDKVLRVLGSHSRRLLSEVETERARREQQGGVAVIATYDLIEVSAMESLAITGMSEPIEAVHVVLGMFSFPGAASCDVLERCGIEWRPLRSITRRLTGYRWGW